MSVKLGEAHYEFTIDDGKLTTGLTRARAKAKGDATAIAGDLGKVGDAAEKSAAKTDQAGKRVQKSTGDTARKVKADNAAAGASYDEVANKAALAAAKIERANAQAAAAVAAREKQEHLAAIAAERRRRLLERGNLPSVTGGGVNVSHGPSGRSIANARLNLARQGADVFTTAAMGMNPGMIAIQQGPQILEALAQAGIRVGPAMGVAAAGVAALAGGVLILGGNALRTGKDLRTFSSQLGVLADRSGYSVENLGELARTFDVWGASAEEARQQINILLKEGIRPERLREFGEAAFALAKVQGVDLVDATKAVAQAFSGTFEDVVRLDNQLGFLTDAEREQIKALYDSGRAGEARNLAFKVFNDKYGPEYAEAMKGAAGLTRALAGAWDALVTAMSNTAPVKNATADIIAQADALTMWLTNMQAAKTLTQDQLGDRAQVLGSRLVKEQKAASDATIAVLNAKKAGVSGRALGELEARQRTAAFYANKTASELVEVTGHMNRPVSPKADTTTDPGFGKYDATPPKGRKDNSAERAAKDALRDARAHEDDIARVQSDELSAYDRLAKSAGQRADIERRRINLAEAASDRELARDVEDKNITQAQADELKARRKQVFNAQRVAVALEAIADREERAFEQSRVLAGYEDDYLQIMAGMAKTAKERHEFEKQILAQRQQMERDALEQWLSTSSLSEEEKRARRDGLTKVQGAQTAAQAEAQKTGLDAYFSKIQSIDEAAMDATVNGLDEFNRGLVDIGINGGKGIDVLRNALNRFLSDMMSGSLLSLEQMGYNWLKGQGSEGGGFSLGGLFGGGSGAGAASAGGGGFGFGSVSIPFGGFRAGGGAVSAGNAYVVGEERPEVFVPNVSGYIHPNTGGGQSGPTEILVHVTSDNKMFEAKVTRIASATSAAYAGKSLEASPGYMNQKQYLEG